MSITLKFKSVIRFFWMSAIFIVLSQAAQAQTGLTEDRILNALEKAYTGKSFTVDYTQTSTLSALDIIETATGKASFSYPGKMKWEYREPENHQVITNGTTLWIYRPNENQVMVGSAGQFFKSGAGGAFLSDISLIRTDYEMNIINESDTHLDVRLIAKKKNPQITSIIIRLSKDNWLIERVKTYNEYEDTTVFELYNPVFGDIDPLTFEFRIPENINVLEME